MARLLPCPWCAALPAHPAPPAPSELPASPAAPIEPETLAALPPDEARDAVAALSPTQRLAQAVAQAAWLDGFGYPVTVAELLGAWDAAAPAEGGR